MDETTEIERTWMHYRRDYEAYLKLERGMADNSVKAYMQDFTHMQQFMCEQGIVPEQVAHADLQCLLKQLCDPGHCPAHGRPCCAHLKSSGIPEYLRMGLRLVKIPQSFPGISPPDCIHKHRFDPVVLLQRFTGYAGGRFRILLLFPVSVRIGNGVILQPAQSQLPAECGNQTVQDFRRNQ